MIIEGIKRSMIGIAFSCIITFIAITIIHFTNTDASISEIWLSMLWSMILGVYFGLSSLIFVRNGMSMLKQTAIHFILSMIVYFSIALPMGWIPFTVSAIIWSSVFFIIIYAVFWGVYYLYYKKIEAAMNENLKKGE